MLRCLQPSQHHRRGRYLRTIPDILHRGKVRADRHDGDENGKDDELGEDVARTMGPYQRAELIVVCVTRIG